MTEITLEPEVVYIAKQQHVGAPAIPVVSVGDHVNAGQPIGKFQKIVWELAFMQAFLERLWKPKMILLP